jgi:hypothetical protein
LHTAIEEREMLPSFIVIGAMKAGTTSLFHYLSDHPQIFLHPRKEIGYFMWPEAERKPEAYEAFFTRAPSGGFCGDISTGYTKYPQYTGVPERMAELTGEARLIYLVRNPVERVVSHYHHLLLMDPNLPEIDEAVRTNPHYIEFSRYRMQLSLYEPHFDRDQILVVILEELLADKKAAMRKIFEHIGCDPCHVPRNLDVRANASAARSGESKILQAIQRNALYRKVQYRIPPRAKSPVVRMLGRKPPPAPDPTLETLAWIREQVRDDARDLASYLGRSNAIWEFDEP